MRRSTSIGIAAAFVLSIGFGSPAQALTLETALSERVEKAHYIAVGTVVERKAATTRVKKIPMIYTTVKLRVERCVKHPSGDSEPAELEIQVPGGEVGNLTMHVSETPSFREGERVVVLLKKPLKSRACQLVNGSFGKYTILKDPKTGKELVGDAYGKPLKAKEKAPLPLLDARARQAQAPSESETAEAEISLSQFLHHLESLVHERTP